MLTEDIDWDAFTHMLYFNFMPHEDGTLSEVADYQNMNPDRLEAIVSAAHENDVPILYTVGGWDTRSRFNSAYSDTYREQFISNLIGLMKRWGFDGIDIDMEPIGESDTEGYKRFIKELYEALQNESTPLLDKPLLTAAANWQPSMFADIQQYFDQINIMTYDMSGAWQGWVAWHNSPLHNGGHTFPSTGRELPSIENEVEGYIEAGVSPSKIGLGIDFYGYVWEGVSEPREGWQDGNTPTVRRPGGIPYHQLFEDYDLLDASWDNDAMVPYVSVENPKQFVSFDNERSILEKINYIREQDLGGAILWELSGGFRNEAPESEQDLLLQAVKKGLKN